MLVPGFRMTAVMLFRFWTVSPGAGQPLLADYQFHNLFASSVSGAPAVVPLGPFSFVTGTVAGQSRTVPDFQLGSGLLFSPNTSILSGEQYSLAMLFEFNGLIGYLTSHNNVGAMAIVLSFDSSLFEIGTPYVSRGLSELTVIYHVSDGLVRLVFYGPGVEGLPPGDEVIGHIPAHHRNSGGAQATMELVSEKMAHRSAPGGSDSIRNGIRAIGHHAAPLSFSLESARLDPFNPSTQIAYNVPVSAQVTLRVHNHLGQEITELVDQDHVPGRYAATWTGTKRAGQAVASGVYIYQIATDAGYNASKRVTLLK